MARVFVASELPGAGGRLATAAAFAVACAGASHRGDGPAPVALVDVGGARRGPTLLASAAARELETSAREAGSECAARGRIAWVRLPEEDGWEDALGAVLQALNGAAAVVVAVSAPLLRPALERSATGGSVPGVGTQTPFAAVDGVLLRAELPAQRALAALAVGELRAAGLAVRVTARSPGRVGARRALAGLEPGGEASRRAARLATALMGTGVRERRRSRPGARLAAEAGQALPLMLGGVLALICATLALAALGGAVTGKSRTQRAADLAALSAARSMRDDFDRLFVPAENPDGSANLEHLAKAEYLDRAEAAAELAAHRNGVGEGRLEVEFPGEESFAPLRVRAEIAAELDTPGELPWVPVVAHAEAEAVPAAAPATATGATGPEYASGGGYSGRLEYRQGEGLRPDVAAAFDRLAAAAAADGVSLLISYGFRSDAEQAILWAQNPDPRYVAPPGTSLHRCATEIDVGPPSAYGWLAANAERFGFLQRYWWEDWHYGYVAGPAPCSAEGDRVGDDGSAEPPAGSADGRDSAVSLPSFVPAEFREAIACAARRWDVSGALLAAQLMAESNFNPFAVSPAGAAGIAQFMPGTAAAYGLDDPFDAEAAIDAQAHLMSDLLEQFGDVSLALAAYNAGPGAVEPCMCIPDYPETQAYVARILGLMRGAGATVVAGGPPPLEVRLVE